MGTKTKSSPNKPSTPQLTINADRTASESDENAIVLCGRLATAPDIRAFASGTRLARLLVTTRTEYERPRTDVIPVTVWNPESNVADAQKGDHVRVGGMIQRRFWNTEDGRTSRVEVVASTVAVVPTVE